MPAPIDDPADPRLDDYRAARDGGLGLTGRTFLAESPLVVRALLASPRFRIRSVLSTPAALAGLEDRLAGRGDVPVYVARAALIRQVVRYEFHRGCLAAAEAAPPVALDQLVARPARLLLALDRVTDPDNVGAVFRSLRAFGGDGVLLGPGCCEPLHRKALRVSMGAALEVPYARAPAWPEELARVRAAGFSVIALTPRGEVEIGNLARRERIALVVGSETDGVGAEALASADQRIRIALAPGVDSLNLAAAAAIALHHLGAPGPG